MKKPLILIAAIVFLFGCHKEKGTTPVAAGYKMEILKGNNQTDTLGNLLKDSVVVKATKDGNVLNDISIQFETSGCDNNANTEIPVQAGIAAWQWRLNGTTGKQTLKIVLLGAQKARLDSIEADAVGIMPTHGWYHSSCTPVGNPVVNGFCKLSSGRLIAAFNSYDYPYYSDDNAITWHPLKSFPLGSVYSTVDKLIATSSDEIFAATANNGLYYSNDRGQTWVARNPGITDNGYFVDLNYTTSGKLIYTSFFGEVCISADKGLTWALSTNGLSPGTWFFYPAEQTNGDLYLVDHLGELFKSVNGGQQWSRVNLSFTDDVQSIFIDVNGNMYIGAGNNTAELYRSTDNGSTWTKLYTAAPIAGLYREIQLMSKQNSGTYYFYTYGNGLVSTADFTNFMNIAPAVTEQSRTYITTKSGNLVIGDEFYGIYYNLP